MSRNNTGNPIGSKAFPDFEDNVKNLDQAVNAPQDTFQDRLGKSRLTWAGMESGFDNFLQASGYQDLGEYAPGIEITAHNQYVTFGGQPYLLKPSIPVPYTTSGEWTGDDFKLIGDDSLRQDLANPDIGASAIGFKQKGVGAVSRNAQEKFEEWVSVKDFGAVGDGVNDDTQAVQSAVDFCISAGLDLHIPRPPNFYLVSDNIVVENATDMEIVIDKSAIFRSKGGHTDYPIYPENPSIPMSENFFVLEGCVRTDIIGGHFDGSAGTWGAGLKSSEKGSNGIMIRNCESCRMIGVYVKNIGTASRIWSGGQKRSIGGFVTQSRTCGIYDSEATECGYEGFSARIAIEGFAFINNKQINDNPLSAHFFQPVLNYGPHDPLPEHSYCHNIVISGNIAVGQGSDITLHGTHCSVVGNTFIDVLTTPIDVRANAGACSIVGNTIRCGGLYARGQVAIGLLFGIPNCVIVGNVVENYDNMFDGSANLSAHYIADNMPINVGDCSPSATAMGVAAGWGAMFDHTTNIGNLAGNRGSGICKTNVGSEAGLLNTSGDNGINIGYRAGRGASGVNSTFVGFQAGQNSTYSRTIGLGHNAQPTGDDQFKIPNNYHFEIGVSGTPPSPPSNNVRIFGRSVGGVVRLAAIFPNGNIVDIATGE